MAKVNAAKRERRPNVARRLKKVAARKHRRTAAKRLPRLQILPLRLPLPRLLLLKQQSNPSATPVVPIINGKLLTFDSTN